MPSFNDDINQRDLSEAPRLAKDKQSYGSVVGIVCAVLLFGVLLILGSQPELTPEEIIAMEGYEGEQPTRHIFNLQSMEESEATSNSARVPEPVVTNSDTGEQVVASIAAPNVTEAATVSAVKTPVEKPVIPEAELLPAEESAIPEAELLPVEEPIIPEAELLPLEEPVIPEAELLPVEEPEIVTPAAVATATSEPTIVEPEIAEVEISEQQVAEPVVPAVVEAEISPVANDRPSIFERAPEERVVASMASTPKLDEQPDTVVVSTAVVDELAPMPIRSSPSATTGERVLLPLRTVLNESTELKAEPDEESDTLILLGKGVVVSAFERRGDWIYVGTNDGSATTGYVQESWLVEIEPQ